MKKLLLGLGTIAAVAAPVAAVVACDMGTMTLSNLDSKSSLTEVVFESAQRKFVRPTDKTTDDLIKALGLDVSFGSNDDGTFDKIDWTSYDGDKKLLRVVTKMDKDGTTMSFKYEITITGFKTS